MASGGDHGHGGGFALNAFWFAIAVIVFIVGVSTIGYFLERYGVVDVVREDPPPRQRDFRGVTPPLPSRTAPNVATPPGYQTVTRPESPNRDPLQGGVGQGARIQDPRCPAGSPRVWDPDLKVWGSVC